MSVEQDTEWILNNILANNGWIIDNTPDKNVFFQKSREEHKNKLETFSRKKGYKKPDYILYKDNQIAGVIEAKKGGESLEKALRQATEYAEMLEAPLVFASNGAYVETYHLYKKKPLFINNERLDRLVKYKEAIEFIESGENAIFTIPPELIKSKEELIQVFKKVNNLLRKANILSGYDRISEFSTILFLKLISEQEGEKSYWNSIKIQKDDFLFSYLNNTVIKDLEKHYRGGVFSDITIKKPQTLRQIMNMIDPLILSDIKTDIKGDAFEYFLRNMNQADNDLGQYFTPRHIIQAMVHLVNPKFKETVYDPFCGSGGFLIGAFNHIKENSIIESKKDKKILREATVFGRDATKVSSIAKKNMILHGDGHSNVKEMDSLENPLKEKVNTILTNIPFGLKDIDCTNFYYNGLGKNNGDAVCVLHCLDALAEGGRMAIIVPEGFLFNDDLAEVRKFLLSKANLELVVSLPRGVFEPYTSVKTDILYFSNAHKPENREGYYYFEVKNDGFTLNKRRAKIDGMNDIHRLESVSIIKSEEQLLNQQNFEFVSFEQVRNNNYNLIGIVYRGSYYNGQYEFKGLLDVLSVFETGKRPKGGINHIHTGAISLGGEQIGRDGKLNLKKIPFVPLDFLKKSKKGVVEQKDILMCKDGALTGKVCFVDINFPVKEVMVNEHVYIMRANQDVVLQKYLFFVLLSQETQKQIITLAYNKSGQPGLNQSHLKKIQIPIPSITKQQEIIKELEQYQKIIDSQKETIKLLEAKIVNNLNSLWQSEEDNEKVADKSIFEILVSKASEPL